MKPLISIVIPTKGRVKYVNALAADLVSAPGYSSSKIDIIVLDNATPNASYDLPVYVRLIGRKIAVSAIENILSAASICNGSYSWIIGDDDAFSHDIFLRIFELIDRYEPKIIRLNHQYIETDDIIRTYHVSEHTRYTSNKWSSHFEWNCFSPASITRFEDKAGFISANIIRSDVLEESLRLTRQTTNSFIYTENVYIPKLYMAIALCLAGGYWSSSEILVKQRIPLTGRNFVDNGSDWFKNFVEAPAEVYRVCKGFNKSYAALLLLIHYSKRVDYDYAAASSVPISQCLRYIRKNLLYMGIRAGSKSLRTCLASYSYHYSTRIKAFLRRIV